MRSRAITVQCLEQSDDEELSQVLLGQCRHEPLPDWIQASETPVFSVPGLFASLVVMGLADSILIPSPRCRIRVFAWTNWRPPRQLEESMIASQDPMFVDDEVDAAFTQSRVQMFLHTLRVAISHPPGRQQLSSMIQHCHANIASFEMEKFPQVGITAFEELLNVVLLADLLRNANDLRDCMESSARLLLPVAQLPEVLERLNQSQHLGKGVKCVKSSVSRARLILDVGMMLRQRCLHERARINGVSYIYYIAWDSSPQYNRDYEMVLLTSVNKAELVPMHQAYSRLHKFWGGSLDEVEATIAADQEEEAMREELQLMVGIRSALREHVLPVVLIGFGNCSFARKVESLVHALRLERWGNADVVDMLRNLVACMQDLGVERGFPRMMPIFIDDLIPWFIEPPAGAIGKATSFVCSDRREEGEEKDDRADGGDAVFEEAAPGQCVFEDPVFEGVGEDHGNAMLPDEEDELGIGVFEDPVFEGVGEDHGNAMLPDEEDEFGMSDPRHSLADVSQVLDAPPLHHIIDNATEGLGTAMKDWEPTVDAATLICKLVGRRDHRPRLLQRCFSSDIGATYIPALQKFRGHIFRGRWGTVAFGIQEVLKIQGALRWGWDLDAYLHGENRYYDTLDGGAVKRPHALDVNEIDAAIRRPFFWAMMITIDMICGTIRALIIWSERCPCHPELLEHPISIGARRGLVDQWMKCPWLGEMLPRSALESSRVSWSPSVTG